MHKIHVTEGIILSKRSLGEANVSISILTANLGLVWASARSARAERSKLRYGLEPLGRGRISLVQGKLQWRLVGVEQVSNDFSAAGALRRAAAGRVSKLLLRLVAGEEPTPALYAAVAEGFSSIAYAKNDADAEALECVLVLRILSHLGYLPQRPELTPFISNNIFSLELAAAAARERSLLIKEINKSLGATGL